jgi:hypothetical protein
MKLTAPDGTVCDDIDGVLYESGQVTDGLMGYDGFVRVTGWPGREVGVG